MHTMLWKTTDDFTQDNNLLNSKIVASSHQFQFSLKQSIKYLNRQKHIKISLDESKNLAQIKL